MSSSDSESQSSGSRSDSQSSRSSRDSSDDEDEAVERQIIPKIPEQLSVVLGKIHGERDSLAVEFSRAVDRIDARRRHKEESEIARPMAVNVETTMTPQSYGMKSPQESVFAPTPQARTPRTDETDKHASNRESLPAEAIETIVREATSKVAEESNQVVQKLAGELSNMQGLLEALDNKIEGIKSQPPIVPQPIEPISKTPTPPSLSPHSEKPSPHEHLLDSPKAQSNASELAKIKEETEQRLRSEFKLQEGLQKSQINALQSQLQEQEARIRALLENQERLEAERAFQEMIEHDLSDDSGKDITHKSLSASMRPGAGTTVLDLDDELEDDSVSFVP